MLFFRNDYSNGAHPTVMDALCRTNLELTVGYGMDHYCAEAADMIRSLCQCPQAEVHFLVGGTQANKTALGAFLRPWEAVIAAGSGHINVHEAGAIEHNGHKICDIPTPDGKLTPDMIRCLCAAHADEMMVAPKLVYISNTTELGTVYSRAELQALRAVCDELDLLLYCDGARLACAMAVSDTTYADYAVNCEAFTIGGTKNGLLFGETLIITNAKLFDGFRSCMKQQGATLAKGRLLGVQFAAILHDDLYGELGRHSCRMAEKLTAGLKALEIPFMIDSPSNQIFPVLPGEVVAALREKVSFEFWSHVDGGHDAIRFVTAWHTTEEEVTALLHLLRELLAA